MDTPLLTSSGSLFFVCILSLALAQMQLGRQLCCNQWPVTCVVILYKSTRVMITVICSNGFEADKRRGCLNHQIEPQCFNMQPPFYGQFSYFLFDLKKIHFYHYMVHSELNTITHKTQHQQKQKMVNWFWIRNRRLFCLLMVFWWNFSVL